jgi:hypothetical protein
MTAVIFAEARRENASRCRAALRHMADPIAPDSLSCVMTGCGARRRFVGKRGAALIAFVVASSAHCATRATRTSGSTGTGGNLQVIAEFRDVIFQGGATDEAAYTLLHITPVSDPQSDATFTYPVDGTVVAAGAAPTFTWQSALATMERTSERRLGVVFIASPHEETTYVSRFELALGVRAAYAHGTPMSGPGYFITFATAMNPKLLRVFTGNTSYAPDATAFGRLRSAGDVIHAQILSAVFIENRIALSSGPYQGPSIGFTVK